MKDTEKHAKELESGQDLGQDGGGWKRMWSLGALVAEGSMEIRKSQCEEMTGFSRTA